MKTKRIKPAPMPDERFGTVLKLNRLLDDRPILLRVIAETRSRLVSIEASADRHCSDDTALELAFLSTWLDALLDKVMQEYDDCIKAKEKYLEAHPFGRPMGGEE